MCAGSSCGPGAAFPHAVGGRDGGGPHPPGDRRERRARVGRWVRGDQEIRYRRERQQRHLVGDRRAGNALGVELVPPVTSPAGALRVPFRGPPALHRSRWRRDRRAWRFGPRMPPGTSPTGRTRCGSTTSRPRGCDRSLPAARDGGAGTRSRSHGTTRLSAFAPIARVHYRLCGPGGCRDGAVEGTGVHALGPIVAPDQGDHTAPGLARGRGGQPVVRALGFGAGPSASRPGSSAGGLRSAGRRRSAQGLRARGRRPLRPGHREHRDAPPRGRLVAGDRRGTRRATGLWATWTTSASAPARSSSAPTPVTSRATRAPRTAGPTDPGPRSTCPCGSPPAWPSGCGG